jgi:hypothetical protein
MNQNIPENSWQLYLETVAKATASINRILAGKPMGPLLNQFLHIMIFQQGICVARWVNNNKDLVNRLNEIQSYTREEFDQIAGEVRGSVDKLVKI